MAFEIPFPIDVKNAIQIDKRFGDSTNGYAYWNTIIAAKAGVPLALRVQGLTVGVIAGGEVVEYWWKAGVADSDLVAKATTALSVSNGLTQTGSVAKLGGALTEHTYVFSDDLTDLQIAFGQKTDLTQTKLKAFIISLLDNSGIDDGGFSLFIRNTAFSKTTSFQVGLYGFTCNTSNGTISFQKNGKGSLLIDVNGVSLNSGDYNVQLHLNNAGISTNKVIKYEDDYSTDFDSLTLVPKSYVDDLKVEKTDFVVLTAGTNGSLGNLYTFNTLLKQLPLAFISLGSLQIELAFQNLISGATGTVWVETTETTTGLINFSNSFVFYYNGVVTTSYKLPDGINKKWLIKFTCQGGNVYLEFSDTQAKLDDLTQKINYLLAQ